MAERRVKVSGLYAAAAIRRGWPAPREVPLLCLAGLWLAAGFEVGGQVWVGVRRRRLVLTVIAGDGGAPGPEGE